MYCSERDNNGMSGGFNHYEYCIRPSDDVCLNVCADPCNDAGVFENSDGDGKGLDLSDNDTFLNLDVSCYISVFKCFKSLFQFQLSDLPDRRVAMNPFNRGCCNGISVSS